MIKRLKTEIGNQHAKFALWTAAVFLGMKYIFPMLTPFLAALILARLLYPLSRAFEKKAGWKRERARLAAYGLFLVAAGSLAAAVVYFLYRMGSGCLGSLSSLQEGARQMFDDCCSRLEAASGIAMEEIQRTVSDNAAGLTESALAVSKDAGWQMLGFLARAAVALVAAFLMLNDYEHLIGALAGTKTGGHAICVLRNMKSAAGAYLKAQLSIMGIITTVCIGGFFLLRIPYAFGIGLAVGVFDALPFFGTGTVLVPWALLDFLLGNYGNAAGCLAIYVVCSLIRQLLEPKLVGKRLGVPPLAVLASIYIGIQIYGGMGLVMGPVSALLLYEGYRLFYGKEMLFN